MKRAREWLFHKLNKKIILSDLEFQKGCPEIIPGLSQHPYWPREKLPWIQEIENQIPIIKEELLTLRSQKGFQPYRGPTWTSSIKSDDGIGSKSHDSGDWNVFYLTLHGMSFKENQEKCSKTMEMIKNLVPRNYDHAFFSAVVPGTHIMKHHGPTNKKLRLHIPLLSVEGSKMRVADEIKEMEAGKAYVFDDSFEHEVWHEGPATRIILIVDFWHPDLTDEEIKFFRVLMNSKLRMEKMVSELDEKKDNFFGVIEESKSILQDNEWWV